MNKFQNIIKRRIQGLLLDAQSAGEPQHNPTAGYLREKYITQFLKEMSPWGISLSSGVIFDACDHTSPALDLIAVDNSPLPAIALHEGLSMVPAEAALLIAEIKSVLTRDSLSQVATHNRFTTTLAVFATSRNLIIPTAIIALDSQLSKESVIEWMQESSSDNLVNGNTVMCCVIGKYYLSRQGREIIQWDANDENQETLSFIADFWGVLTHLSRRRRMCLTEHESESVYPHPLEGYLKNMGQ
jgi:hypothetical protein